MSLVKSFEHSRAFDTHSALIETDLAALNPQEQTKSSTGFGTQLLGKAGETANSDMKSFFKDNLHFTTHLIEFKRVR